MMDPVQLRRLIAYNQWADERLLAAVDGLSAEELEQPRAAYFGNLANNLWHMLTVQRLWLARWTGDSLPPTERPMIPSWRAAYAASHAALRDYVASLTAADLERLVKYTPRSGGPREQPLGQLILHLANHGTAHRAETGLLLERLGHSPGDLDYTIFMNEVR
jgi:uncharacterized damage-inducible protein DinB